MSVDRSGDTGRAMSLIELLAVMAIVALLAAMLLPALGQAKARARRIQCIDHLRQTGIGFASFAHEHNGRFPMAVPGSAGGSLEFAQSGYLLQGDFYFSFRHFQAASNDLVTPRLLVCPADTRLPASSFATLDNANLSYFIGVNAELAHPTSMLAGDRNLTNDYTSSGTIARLGNNHALRWTEAMHRFRGNILFADGHVEEKNSPALVPAATQAPGIANLVFPTLRQGGGRGFHHDRGSSPSAPGAAGAPGISSPDSYASPPASQPMTAAASVSRPVSRGPASPPSVVVGDRSTEETPAPPKVQRRPTNSLAPSSLATSGAEPATLSPFSAWLTELAEMLAKRWMWWLYALLLLILVVAIVLRRVFRRRTK